MVCLPSAFPAVRCGEISVERHPCGETSSPYCSLRSPTRAALRRATPIPHPHPWVERGQSLPGFSFSHWVGTSFPPCPARRQISPSPTYGPPPLSAPSSRVWLCLPHDYHRHCEALLLGVLPPLPALHLPWGEEEEADWARSDPPGLVPLVHTQAQHLGRGGGKGQAAAGHGVGGISP